MTSPYLTTREAALYLRFVQADGQTPNMNALKKWMQRRQIPITKRGRSVLIHKDDLEATLTRRTA